MLKYDPLIDGPLDLNSSSIQQNDAVAALAKNMQISEDATMIAEGTPHDLLQPGMLNVLYARYRGDSAVVAKLTGCTEVEVIAAAA
jgi:hypothetical protein